MSTGSAVTWLTYESVKRGLTRWGQQQPQQQQQGLASGSQLQGSAAVVEAAQ
jgi:hypothetical protein